MEVSQLTQMKELQEENRKLKAMYADLALDHRILKEIVAEVHTTWETHAKWLHRAV
ncbi:hypothetical protein [Chitinophaga sp. CF418]|uniref:hypothetical protein n=1 Tax=Chitinophaga sp. CF418 TaxID=1855287 RepID=UPI00091F6A9F|nr:hypothetical protein SAMN05216311_11919 [Chitinophaga sp. CF418]